jgi:hypothetical protein
MPVKPTRSATLKTAMIVSGPMKKSAYQMTAGTASHAG